MKKVGVIRTPLRRALSTSASSRALARASESGSSGKPASSTTATRSSSVKSSERDMSSTCARQNMSSSDAVSATTAARRAKLAAGNRSLSKHVSDPVAESVAKPAPPPRLRLDSTDRRSCRTRQGSGRRCRSRGRGRTSCRPAGRAGSGVTFRLHDPPTLAAAPLRCPPGGGIRALRRLGSAHCRFVRCRYCHVVTPWDASCMRARAAATS